MFDFGAIFESAMRKQSDSQKERTAPESKHRVNEEKGSISPDFQAFLNDLDSELEKMGVDHSSWINFGPFRYVQDNETVSTEVVPDIADPFDLYVSYFPEDSTVVVRAHEPGQTGETYRIDLMVQADYGIEDAEIVAGDIASSIEDLNDNYSGIDLRSESKRNRRRRIKEQGEVDTVEAKFSIYFGIDWLQQDVTEMFGGTDEYNVRDRKKYAAKGLMQDNEEATLTERGWDEISQAMYEIQENVKDWLAQQFENAWIEKYDYDGCFGYVEFDPENQQQLQLLREGSEETIFLTETTEGSNVVYHGVSDIGGLLSPGLQFSGANYFLKRMGKTESKRKSRRDPVTEAIGDLLCRFDVLQRLDQLALEQTLAMPPIFGLVKQQLPKEPEELQERIAKGLFRLLSQHEALDTAQWPFSPVHALTEAVSGPVDPDAAQELRLYIDNDGDLYRQMTTPIINNLMRKWKKGTYDSELAVKAFMYLANEGARKYVREHGGPGDRVDTVFNKNTRMEVAKALRDSFEGEAELGNYDRF